MKRIQLSVLLFLSISAFVSCQKEKSEKKDATVFKAAGDISATLTEFRNSLGNVNTTTGATGGRREINWDGVPSEMLNKPLPSDFFNPVGATAEASRQRGLTYSNGNFQVSANKFADVNSEAAPEFNAFSGDKVFANISKNQWPVQFQVAGQATPAHVSAFGMVFSDVDSDTTTSLEFFDGAESLGKFFVPAHDASSSFSFLGVRFANRTITKVLVTHQGFLSAGEKDISQGGSSDLIVADDMIYSEPVQEAH